MSRQRSALALLVGAAATAVLYVVLYGLVWVPGVVVLIAAGVGGTAAGRVLGLAPRVATLLPLLVIACVAPTLMSTTDLVQTLVLGIAALGLTVLLGQSGQLSLAQGTMLGLGAYTTAILATDHGWPVLLTLPAATAVAGIAGWLLGLVAVRFDGVYLAILTGAFAIVAPILLKYFADLTGGVQGIAVWSPESPIAALSDDEFLYLVVLVATVLAVGLTWNVSRGPVGLSFRAMHDSPIAARGVGVSLGRAKMQAFLVSALLAGLAGGLYATTVGFVSPDSFGLLLGIHLMVMVVIGGTRSIAGPFLGAAAVHYLQVHLTEVRVPVGPDLVMGLGPQAVFGLVLIAVLLVVPTGLVGLPAPLRSLVVAGRARIRGDELGRADDRPSRDVVDAATAAHRRPGDTGTAATKEGDS